jgi:hypothetical protein
MMIVISGPKDIKDERVIANPVLTDTSKKGTVKVSVITTRIEKKNIFNRFILPE